MPNQGGATSMAKIQKSLMLHEGLCKLLEAEQAKTGVSFTRLMTAAAMRFLFSDLYDLDNPLWLRLATNVEMGNLSLGDVPDQAFSTILQVALKNQADAKKRKDKKAEVIAEHEAAEASRAIQRWSSIRSKHEDPIQAFVEQKNRLQQRWSEMGILRDQQDENDD